MCLGNHAGDPPPVEAPNKHGLSLDIYKRKFMAEPPTYKTALHIPGVVFFRAASRRHPMAPSEADYSASDGDSDSTGSENEMPGQRNSLMQRLWRKLKRSTISREDQHAAATVLQGMYRLRAAKRVVYRLRREEAVRARLRATLYFQRMMRAKIQVRKLRQTKAATEQAACIIQKNYRFHKWHREVQSDRARAAAALLVQDWYRRHLARENFKILRLRLSAKLSSLGKARSLIDLERFLLGYAGRARARRMRKVRQQQNFAACMIQDFMLRFFGNGRSVKQTKMPKAVKAAQQHAVASRIQRAFRYSAQYRAGKIVRKHMIGRLIQIQCTARRFLARLERWARKRRRESVWAWLAPKVPRGWYEQHLAVPNYEVMFRDKLLAIRGGQQLQKEESKYDVSHIISEGGEDTDKALAWLSNLNKAFQSMDANNTGTVTKLEFWRVLDGCGIRLKPEFKQYIAEAFINPLTDSVSWIAYIRFGSSSPGLCPLHRVPVCPECLYVGPCPLSGCKEYRPNQNERFTESSICVCGFHISRHRPALRKHTDILGDNMLKASSVAADTRSQVARYAFQDPPEMPRPVTPPNVRSSGRVTIAATDAFTRVHGIDVKVVPVPEAALQVREGQSLKVMQAQRRALQAYLKMATAAAQKPMRKEMERQELEGQRHKYFYEQSLKKSQFELRSSKPLRDGTADKDSSHNLFSTIGPDGQALTVRQRQSEKFLILESGIDGAGIKSDEYLAAAKTGTKVPLPSAVRTEHFMDLSECAAAAADEKRGPDTKDSWIHKISAAKRSEIGLMKVESGDLVPGLVGAGKAAAVLPYEAHDKVDASSGRGFRLSRPVMYIHNGDLQLTSDATLLYLSLMRTFAAPNLDGYDLLADQQRCIKYCFDHHSFLDQHWDKLVKDIRFGSLSVHLKLDKGFRARIQQDLQPDATRADHIEKVFKKLGYKRRAIARAAQRLPSNYLKVGKESAEDPAVLRRKLKITNRERFRHGPSSQLAKLPQLPLASTGQESLLESLKASANSSVRGSHTSSLAKAMGMHNKMAAVVQAAQTAKQVKALGIPTIVVDDTDGTEFEFGFIEGAARPYLDLHPGSGAAFTSIKTALEHAKRHAGTHLRTQSAADHFLKSTWEAAGIAEWPGEEVLPEQREFPQETEARELLKQHLHKEKIPEDSLERFLLPASEASNLVVGRPKVSSSQSRVRPSAGTPWNASRYSAELNAATERKTPAQCTELTHSPGDSPNTNTNMSFETGWLEAGSDSMAEVRSPTLKLGKSRATPSSRLHSQIELTSAHVYTSRDPILHQLPFGQPLVARLAVTPNQHTTDEHEHNFELQVSTFGTEIKSPPMLMQEPFKLPGCPRHQWLAPGPTCPTCRQYRRSQLPQPPCTFFQAMHLHREGNKSLSGLPLFERLLAGSKYTHVQRSSSSRLSSAGLSVTQDRMDTAVTSFEKDPGLNDFLVAFHSAAGMQEKSPFQTCAMVGDGASAYPLLVQYLCVDRNKALWIMGFRLWRVKELARKVEVRPGFNKQFETVRGGKPVYLKVGSSNIRSIGCAVRTHHIKFFKKAVQIFRMNQMLAEQGIHPDHAGKAETDKVCQRVQQSGPVAMIHCYYFYDVMAPADEDSCWALELEAGAQME